MGAEGNPPEKVVVLPEVTITPEDKDKLTSVEAAKEQNNKSRKKGNEMITHAASLVGDHAPNLPKGAQEGDAAQREKIAYDMLSKQTDADLEKVIAYAQKDRSPNAQLNARVAARILSERTSAASGGSKPWWKLWS